MSARVAGLLCALALGVAGACAAQAPKPAARADDDVRALPLHVLATKTPPPIAMAVVLTGDGGWAGIDRRIAQVLSDHDVSVVGLDSRSYLMHGKTPDEAAADIARIMRRYSAQWSPRVAIIGYSRGADMAPFIVNRLPADLRRTISLVALLGPAERADFQFHWADLLTETSKPSDPPILPELERMRGMPTLCVFGQDEKESLCRLADTTAVRVDRRPGRHHFDGDYDAIAWEILRLIAPQD
ncbi:MAG TPA: AcvB/VirJ family lysyl-phosphatidylglycerol hydrolase [Gemmatimonadaceae bacterium]|nr:AcvB/VirJ family lysyl-phosphatidylglycerol hydrolase [Gemmatimonadaceae bacterium]